MSTITTTAGTERLTKQLQRAGINQWVARSSGDAWGKYLRFQVGGRCVGGCGWSLAEAEEIVKDLISLNGEECE